MNLVAIFVYISAIGVGLSGIIAIKRGDGLMLSSNAPLSPIGVLRLGYGTLFLAASLIIHSWSW